MLRRQLSWSTGKMAARASVREELERLRRDIETMRGNEPADGQPADAAGDDGVWLGAHLKELQQMVQDSLDNAEEAVAEHPRAAIAGALALGIVIGRLTVR
jgi:ElaB/YqjD/DUF883 family membrane-anchored ribosome-binding protein